MIIKTKVGLNHHVRSNLVQHFQKGKIPISTISITGLKNFFVLLIKIVENLSSHINKHNYFKLFCCSNIFI